MAYSDELRVFWFTPLRTATRSCNGLQKYLNFKNYGSHEFFSESHQKDYHLICNVRNPYSRLVSIYSLFCDNFNTTPNNFQGWVEKKLEEEITTPKKTLNYQIILSSIFSEHDKNPNTLIKLETLQQDIRNLWFVKDNSSQDLNNVIEENIVNNKYANYFNNKIPWKSCYNQNLADYVYSYLEEDFLLFGYDKNSWKDGSS